MIVIVPLNLDLCQWMEKVVNDQVYFTVKCNMQGEIMRVEYILVNYQISQDLVAVAETPQSSE